MFVLLALACGAPTDDTVDTDILTAPAEDTANDDLPSFRRDVWPILDANCKICHALPSAVPQLRSDADRDQLVDVASSVARRVYIAPYLIGDSYLWLKLTDQHTAVGGTGDAMPKGRGSLDQADLDTIRDWVREGALR